MNSSDTLTARFYIHSSEIKISYITLQKDVVWNRTTPRPPRIEPHHARRADPLLAFTLVSHHVSQLPYQFTSTQDGPILHDTLYLIDVVGALCTTREHFIEAFEAKTPVTAARSVIPNVGRKMREEVMLRTLQASILTDAIVRSNVRSNAMLCSTMVSSKSLRSSREMSCWNVSRKKTWAKCQVLTQVLGHVLCCVSFCAPGAIFAEHQYCYFTLSQMRQQGMQQGM